MLLAIDVGNTNTVLGLYRLGEEAGSPATGLGRRGADKPELAAHWRVTTHRSQTADEYGVLFVNLFEMNGLKTSQVQAIIISSVVPPVESTLRQVCETYFHVRPLFVEPGIKTGMPVLVDNPSELGADRLVNAIAAFERLMCCSRDSVSTKPRRPSASTVSPARRPGICRTYLERVANSPT